MEFEVREIKRCGFTLVELLVVLAVMVVLASLFFPVFLRVREKVRRTACQSNLKQIALAFQQYVQDNNGRYPALASVQASDWVQSIKSRGGQILRVARLPSK